MGITDSFEKSPFCQISKLTFGTEVDEQMCVEVSFFQNQHDLKWFYNIQITWYLFKKKQNVVHIKRVLSHSCSNLKPV